MDSATEDPVDTISPPKASARTFNLVDLPKFRIIDIPLTSTSFQTNLSRDQSPRPIPTRNDSVIKPPIEEIATPLSPKRASPRLKLHHHLETLPKSAAQEALKYYRRQLLIPCPILGTRASRIHAIVSWGGNLLSTLSLRPVVDVERLWLEDIYPTVYGVENQGKRLKNAKIKAREQPEREWGFGVDPFEGVDGGELVWRLEDVFDLERYYGGEEGWVEEGLWV